MQSCPALVSHERVRPASDEPADSPAQKVLRTCFSMSNLQVADVHHQKTSPNQTYSVVARHEDGRSKVFNFSSTDTIQSMIETMGKSSHKSLMRSSGSCHSISEDVEVSEGLVFEPGKRHPALSNGLSMTVPTPAAPTTPGPVHQLIEGINDSTVPLSEDTMRSYLHPNIRIQEPRGMYSGLCACVVFLKDIFEANDRPYVVLKESPPAPGASPDIASGTLCVDVTFSPITVEISVNYKSMHGMLAYLEFIQDPREICGYGNPEESSAEENREASLEDPWTFGMAGADQGGVPLPTPTDIPPIFGEPTNQLQPPSLETAVAQSPPLKQEPSQMAEIPAEIPEGFSLAEIFDSSEVSELITEENPDYWGMISVPDAVNSTVPLEQPSSNLAVQEIRVKPTPTGVLPSPPAPAPAAALPKQPVHREGYMRSKAHEAKGLEQDYQCGYCHHIRTSASACSDGRVRIRCACGGKHRDGNPRMHANWKPVKGHIIRKEDLNDNLSVASGATDSSLAGATEALTLKRSISRSASGSLLELN